MISGEWSRPTQSLLPSGVRKVISMGAVAALSATGVLKTLRRQAAEADRIVVLTFHRIVPDREMQACRSPAGMVLRESLFSQLMAYLASTTEIISPRELTRPEPSTASHRNQRPRVLLTFDDGWLDNYDIALPHLARHSAKACFFVVTDFTGKAEPFWPEQVVALVRLVRSSGLSHPLIHLMERLAAGSGVRILRGTAQLREEDLLSWLKQFPPDRLLRETSSALHLATLSAPQLPPHLDARERMMDIGHWQALSEAGHLIGSHTCTHALLAQLTRGEISRELTMSRAALEHSLPGYQRGPLWISYPNGSVSRTVVEMTAKAGYAAGFTTAAGSWQRETDPMLLPRVNIWDRTVSGSDGNFNPALLDFNLFWRTTHAHSVP